MPGYDWVTNEMFDAKLAEILDGLSGGQVLAVGGAYEVFSEHFNNAVLEALEQDREEEAI